MPAVCASRPQPPLNPLRHRPPARAQAMTTADLGALRATLDKCGQQHLLEGYEALAPEQQAELLEQLQVGGVVLAPAPLLPRMSRCRRWSLPLFPRPYN